MNARVATQADLDGVLALLVADEEFFTGRAPKIGLADLRSRLARVDLEHDTWLYEEDGAAAGFGWVEPEYHPRSFEDWWEQRRSAPDFDPTLWFLIRNGDEVVAVVRNDPNRKSLG